MSSKTANSREERAEGPCAGSLDDPPQADEAEILRKRAEELAAEDQPVSASDQEFDVVEFELGCERYAIDLSFVREVYPLKDLTPVPCTPPFVVGIINVRGRILTVIDFKQLFGMPGQDISGRNKIIILESGDMELSILADQILGVRAVKCCEIQPALPTLTGIREEYLRGVCGDRLVILDAESILSSSAKIIVHDQMQA